MERQRYRPSNGTEGEIFEAQWCRFCSRFEAVEGEYCSILGDAMTYEIYEEHYPSEWIKDEKGPRCLAFSEDAGQAPRCLETADLFASNQGRGA